MGTLFYVIGASGAGKDTLMNFARQEQSEEGSFLFAHRYITRPMDPSGENHVALSQSEFSFRKLKGLFALDWCSHDTFYGIGKEIDFWLEQGCNVIINGSRGYLNTALQKYPKMQVILIEVDFSLLRERLEKRGRESKEQIDKRIERARALNSIQTNNLIRFQNNEDLSITGPLFTKLISKRELV